MAEQRDKVKDHKRFFLLSRLEYDMRLNQKFEKMMGEKINMYDLAVWLGKYNRKNGFNLQPSQLEYKHLIKYLNKSLKEN